MNGASHVRQRRATLPNDMCVSKVDTKSGGGVDSSVHAFSRSTDQNLFDTSSVGQLAHK